MKPIALVIGAGKVGCAIAQRLSQRGYTVKIAGHDELELADHAAIQRYFYVHEPLAILVNAAGSYGTIGRVRDVSPGDWQRTLGINLAGVYACCHYAMPRMRAGGHIINIAGGGKGPMEMRSGYAAAKSALWRLTETLAAEEPELRVNAIAPGPMYSRMQESVAERSEPWAHFARELRVGRGAVPVSNTQRALDYLLDHQPTGKLLFARDFKAVAAAAA